MESIIGITDLNFNELVEIEGGHEGTAYEVGHYVGKALMVAACIACFF